MAVDSSPRRRFGMDTGAAQGKMGVTARGAAEASMKEAGNGKECVAREMAQAGWVRLATGALWAAVSTTSRAGGMPSSGLAPFYAMLDEAGRPRLAMALSALGSQGERLAEDGRVCLLIADPGSDPMPLRAVVEGRAQIVEAGSEQARRAGEAAGAKRAGAALGAAERWAIVEPWGATLWAGAERIASLEADEMGAAMKSAPPQLIRARGPEGAAETSPAAGSPGDPGMGPRPS